MFNLRITFQIQFRFFADGYSQRQYGVRNRVSKTSSGAFRARLIAPEKCFSDAQLKRKPTHSSTFFIRGNDKENKKKCPVWNFEKAKAIDMNAG